VTRALVVAAAAVALPACFIHERQPQPPTSAGVWAEQRDLATRGVKLYDGVEHRATASVCHLSLAVREARARRLADWLGWTPTEFEQALAKERAEAAAGEEFLVSFYTVDRFANTLAASDSIWRVALVVDGTDILPTRIRYLDTDHDQTSRALFPMIGPFDSLYRVTYPMPPSGPLEGRPFMLRIASGIGRIDLDYAAKPGLPNGIEVVPPPQH
jgi:hypothetical protein